MDIDEVKATRITCALSNFRIGKLASQKLRRESDRGGRVQGEGVKNEDTTIKGNAILSFAQFSGRGGEGAGAILPKSRVQWPQPSLS
jgi:hypothetical protein